MSQIKTYIKSILFPVLVGGFVGFLISGSMDYSTLVKPLGAPSEFLFPIVWTILYILMGISYGILESSFLLDTQSKFIYYFQLFVDFLWPIFFFLLKWRFFSILWILLLVFLVVWMIAIFYQRNKVSGLLQIPYLLWTIYATYLTISVYLLNRV